MLISEAIAIGKKLAGLQKTMTSQKSSKRRLNGRKAFNESNCRRTIFNLINREKKNQHGILSSTENIFLLSMDVFSYFVAFCLAYLIRLPNMSIESYIFHIGHFPIILV